jgi:hypothetical protein
MKSIKPNPNSAKGPDKGKIVKNCIYIIMWSCPGNMPKYYPPLDYPGLRDILPDRIGGQYVSQTWVIFWHITWTRPH